MVFSSYTIEALANVRTLRVYFMFASHKHLRQSSSHVCNHKTSFNVKLLDHTLLVSCIDGSHGSHGCALVTLQLPLGCLIDSPSLIYLAREDHLEVKMRLLKLATKTEDSDGRSFEDSFIFSSTDIINFYCRKCNEELTSAPLRKVLELPAAHWHEMAEHWFCGDCCGGGDRAHMLVDRLRRLLTVTPGICLLGHSSCVLHSSDLNSDLLQEDSSDVSGMGESSALSVSSSRSEMGSGRSFDGNFDSESSKVSSPTLNVMHSFSFKSFCEGIQAAMSPPGGPTSWLLPKSSSWSKSSGVNDDSLVHPENPFPSHEGPPHMCKSLSHGHSHGGDKNSEGSTTDMRVQDPPNLVPGKGHWEAIHCSCSEIVGVREIVPGLGSNQENGIHLLKHRIAGPGRPGSSLDALKNCSMEATFAVQLQAAATATGGHRFVLRGLNSRAAICHVVLLTCEAWTVTGQCEIPKENGKAETVVAEGKEEKGEAEGIVADNNEDLPGAKSFSSSSPSSASSPHENQLRLSFGDESVKDTVLEGIRTFEKSVKIMFRNVQILNGDESSNCETWAKEQGAQDLFIFESEGALLVKALATSSRKQLPKSCRSFQGFHLAFLPM